MDVHSCVNFFRKKCKIITFKHSVLTNQYLTVFFFFFFFLLFFFFCCCFLVCLFFCCCFFALMILTHPKMKEIFFFTENEFFIDIKKKRHFPGNFKSRPMFFILDEKCFMYCKAFLHVPRHRLKPNLNFEVSSISTTSVS